jgi:hypothetical protein
MPFDSVPRIEKIHPKRRPAIASYIVASWLMQDTYPHTKSIVFEQAPDTHARNFTQHIYESEFRQARQTLKETKPDTNQHLAFAQMGITTKSLNKAVHLIPDFVVATHWMENLEYREKLDSDLEITNLLETKLPYARDHYLDIAMRTLYAFGTHADLRSIISRTQQDAQFWANS